MLREPEAMIAERIAMAGKLEGFTDRGILGSTLGRRRLIEY